MAQKAVKNVQEGEKVVNNAINKHYYSSVLSKTLPFYSGNIWLEMLYGIDRTERVKHCIESTSVLYRYLY
jgi:hypothetical protein